MNLDFFVHLVKNALIFLAYGLEMTSDVISDV